MAKRFSDTEIWSEDWFLEMPNEYKLFWFYMLAKCDHAGLFKVNLRSFRGLIEVNDRSIEGQEQVLFRSSEALKYFNTGKNRIRVISENLWFIEDFFVYQYGTTINTNNRLHESIQKQLEKNGIELTSIRGVLDLKHGVKDKDKDKDSISLTGKQIKKNNNGTGIKFSGNFKTQGQELYAQRIARGESQTDPD